MENKVQDEKCVFCGYQNLVPSKVAFPQKRQVKSISMRHDDQPSYIEDEYVEFDVKRCESCGYIHMFFQPAQFIKSTIK